jgi:TIR domain
MESDKAIQLLKRQIDAIPKLKGLESYAPEFKKWKRNTEITIENIFGKPSRHLKDFGEITYSTGVWFSGMAEDAGVRACSHGLEQVKAILESMIEEIGDFGLKTSTDEAANNNKTSDIPTSKRLFISHSSVDTDVAEALVDLIVEALQLARSDILCTSVDGTRLKGGDDTDDVLRQQISQVPAFLSILTKKSIASTYVLFELGARWGCNKHHIPLLAKSAGPEVLKNPLKKNALKLNLEAQVLQLLNDLASVLGREPQPTNGYVKKVHKVVEVSQQSETGLDDSTSHNDISKSLVRRGNMYYRVEGDKETGPYCMACWDGDGKLVNVMLLPQSRMKCGQCAKQAANK